MRVAHGGVGVENVRLFFHPLAEFFRAHFVQQVFCTFGIRAYFVEVRHNRFAEMFIRVNEFHVRVAIDHDITDEFQCFSATVKAQWGMEQFRVIVDERDGALTAGKYLVL